MWLTTFLLHSVFLLLAGRQGCREHSTATSGLGMISMESLPTTVCSHKTGILRSIIMLVCSFPPKLRGNSNTTLKNLYLRRRLLSWATQHSPTTLLQSRHPDWYWEPTPRSLRWSTQCGNLTFIKKQLVTSELGKNTPLTCCQCTGNSGSTLITISVDYVQHAISRQAHRHLSNSEKVPHQKSCLRQSPLSI